MDFCICFSASAMPQLSVGFSLVSTSWVKKPLGGGPGGSISGVSKVSTTKVLPGFQSETEAFMWPATR